MHAPIQMREFPLKEALKIVEPFMKPNPWVYWCDYLFFMILGWTTTYFVVVLPDITPLRVALFFVASLSLYRAAIFIHELAHLKRGTFQFFRVVWNVTVGIPLFTPDFSYYGVHLSHHKRSIYGTSVDGEYFPFATHKPMHIVLYLVSSSLAPVLFVGRFLFVTPLTFLHPKIRQLSWERFSSLAIDMRYKRDAPDPEDAGVFRLQEIVTMVYAYALFGSIALGYLPMKLFFVWYLAAAFIFFLNALRTLSAHRYRNPGEDTMTMTEEMLDSVDIKGNLFVTAVWAPVGLRYHATHHLFPNLPYHNLGKARRALESQLSDPTLYNLALKKSLWDSVKSVWADAKENGKPMNLSATPTKA